MAQSEYLRLERGLRPKQPEEHPPDQVEQVPHRAFIARFGPSRQADGIYDSDSTRRYLISSIAAGLFARSTVPFANAQSAPRVRVRTLPIEEGAQAFYAQEQGFFSQVEVDLGTLPGGGPAVVAAVASGE